ncbi:PDZ domain-containing protein [Pseudohaliea sp.]|uniref:alpha/beta hydrolase family protein n=1 Tax=Pseudohaliea sp. TaxID=2740289 RepID=UPI0032EBB186
MAVFLQRLSVGLLFALCVASTVRAEPRIVLTDAVSGPAPAVLGGLQRQAALGFRYAEEDGRVVVRSVAESSNAAKAGLAAGDTIVAVSGRRFRLPVVLADALGKLRGDREVELTVVREAEELTIAFTPPTRPWETASGLEAEWSVLDTPDGARLRTIVTRPAGETAPLPALFVVQWVGCDSIEFRHDGPWLMLFRRLAEQSGMAMIRIERSASGDSLGPPCHQLDFDTELAHYEHALAKLADHPWIDGERIVLLSNSLGTKLVALLASRSEPAGVITTSGGGLSYFERMLNFDRHALSHPDRDPEAAHDILMAQIPFQVAYLLEGLEPEAIVVEQPQLDGVWETIAHTGNGHHYGRPYSYHQQAANKNFLGAWARVDAPILVNFNEFDQFEVLRGAELIVATVNRLRPGTATLAVHPRLGHSFYRYASQADAYRWKGGEDGHAVALATILDWLGALWLSAAEPSAFRE